MNKTTIVRSVIGAAAFAAATLPLIASASAQTQSFVIIGRGGAGATSDLAFIVMEEALKRTFPDQSINIRRLPGTASATPPRVESGEADIGHGVGESVLDAWTGTRVFEGREEMRNLRYLGSYLGFLNRPSASPTFVTTQTSAIDSWDDLANKRIGVGPPDSLTSTMVDVALGGVDLSYDKIRENGGLVLTGDWNQQMEMLGDGQLDAVFFTGDHPAPIITQFAANNSPRLVTMSEDVLEALLEAYPTFTRNEMPPQTYDWQDEPVLGVQLSLGYVVHKDMDEEVVYNLCQQLYVGDNAKIWGETVPGWAGAEAMADRAASTVFIPLHPGAQRCFEEAGIPINYIGAGEETP
jgi:TRAP transporter TAXI family solute receptor